MSNIERVENLKQIIQLVQPQFEDLAKIHKAVNYKKEATFALQIIHENEYVRNAALADQDAFKAAIINVAAIGLSLNPIQKLAYLIPRKKKVCLDISYRGYVQLALEVGAIKWAVAEIVREKDEYQFQGISREPIHRFNPFGDRGEIIGAYCIAKTHDGEILLAQMSAEELQSIRDRSEAFKSGRPGPWQTDTTEMIKKTVIKRAAKSWPMIDTRSKERFEQAIDITNDIDFNATQLPEPQPNNPREANFAKIRELLGTLGKEEAKYISHLTKVNNREIKSLQDLTDLEINQAIIMLDQFVLAKNKKEKHENAG